MPATRAALFTDLPETKVPPAVVGELPLDGAWRASKAQARAAAGSVEPERLRSSLIGTVTVVANGAILVPRFRLPLRANHEPKTAASSLERDFLLLTHPIAGATRFVVASPLFGSSSDSRPPPVSRANAQAVCARSEGRIGRTGLRLNRQVLGDCDKAVRSGELLWKGRGKVGVNRIWVSGLGRRW